jgi:hypothetical protein
MFDCDWNSPGFNPFRGGNIEAAISSYGFDDVAKRELVYKIQKGYNDATVFITKEDIKSAFGKASNLRDMHFARNSRCTGSVSRTSWSNSDVQPALVYCHKTDCIAVPIICGNISRIDYVPFVSSPKKEGISQERKPINNIPEPSSIFLVALAIVGIKLLS